MCSRTIALLIVCTNRDSSIDLGKLAWAYDLERPFHRPLNGTGFAEHQQMEGIDGIWGGQLSIAASVWTLKSRLTPIWYNRRSLMGKICPKAMIESKVAHSSRSECVTWLIFDYKPSAAALHHGIKITQIEVWFIDLMTAINWNAEQKSRQYAMLSALSGSFVRIDSEAVFSVLWRKSLLAKLPA